MEACYYNQLDKSSQAAYHAMLTGLRAIAPSFPVPRLEPGQLSEIFLKLRLDHPEIFYAVRFTYRYYPQASSVEMVPEYLFEKSKIQEHQKAMAARIQKLTRPAMSLSDREKEQFVHDFICRNVRYDKLKKPYSHEIIGPLGQGVGVCEGIAKTVKVPPSRAKVWSGRFTASRRRAWPTCASGWSRMSPCPPLRRMSSGCGCILAITSPVPAFWN